MEITSKELYKARPQIMGVAALFVILVHLQVGAESHLVASIHRLTQIGVDIFFFLSGIGCYQSISKRSIWQFYWRRIKRVLPAYVIVFIGYGAFKYFYEGVDIFTYWWTHSIFTFPIDGQTRHWFVFGILVLYLLTPFFYNMIGHYRFWITFVGIILVSSQVWFSPWPVPDNLYVFNELFIARVPVYMLGMHYGRKFSEGQHLEVDFEFYLKLIGVILFMFWDSYFNKVNTMCILHYISIFGAMYITFFLVIVFNKIRVIPLEWLGNASLESYLVNEKITELLMTYTTMDLVGINLNGFVLTFVAAVLLSKICGGDRYFQRS